MKYVPPDLVQAVKALFSELGVKPIAASLVLDHGEHKPATVIVINLGTPAKRRRKRKPSKKKEKSSIVPLEGQ